MAEIKIWVEVETKKATDDIQIFSRDTKKQLDKAVLLDLELDKAKIQIDLEKTRTLLKQAKADNDEALTLQLTLDSNKLRSGLTEAGRILNNYQNTWEKSLSRLQVKFDNITDEIKKSRDELIAVWKSTSWLDKLITKADTLQKEFEAWKIDIKEYINELDKLNTKASNTTSFLWWLWKWLVWLFALDKIKDVWLWLIKLTADAEQTQVVFKNLTWSIKEANDIIWLIRVFSKTTPFEFTELADVSKSLMSIAWITKDNLIPTLTVLWDLARSQWKSIKQTVEAYNDAIVWEFERLKEFWIRASVEWDRVKFTFQWQTTEVAKTQEAIDWYIRSLWNLQWVAWSMEAQSQTLAWQWSNLKDVFDTLAIQIWTSLLPFLKSLVQIFLDFATNFPVLTKVIAIWWVALAWLSATILLLWPAIAWLTTFFWFLTTATIWSTGAVIWLRRALTFLTWPIWLIIWWITALAWLLYTFRKEIWLTWIDFSKFWTWIVDIWKFILSQLTTIFGGLLDMIKWVIKIMTLDFNGWFTSIYNWFVNITWWIAWLFKEIWGFTTKLAWFITRTFLQLGVWIVTFWVEFVISSVKALWAVWQNVRIFFSNMSGEFSSFDWGKAWSWMWEWFWKILQNVLNKAKSIWKDIVNYFKDIFSGWEWNLVSKASIWPISSWKTKAWKKEYIDVSNQLDFSKTKQVLSNIWKDFKDTFWDFTIKANVVPIVDNIENKVWWSGWNKWLNTDTDIPKNWWGSWKSKEDLAEEARKRDLENQKKAYEEARAMRIEYIKKSNDTEWEKARKILEVNEILQQNLKELNETAYERETRLSETRIKKEEEYSKAVDDIFNKATKIQEDYKKKIEDIWLEFTKLKETAKQSIDDINSSLEDLNINKDTKLAERRLTILEEQKSIEKEISDLVWKDQTSEIYEKRNQLLKDQISLQTELSLIEKNANIDVIKSVEDRSKLSDSEKIIADAETQKAILEERKKINEAILEWTEINLSEIKDKENLKFAEDLIKQEENLYTQLTQAETFYKDELSLLKNSDEIKKQIDKDYTAFLKTEIDIRKIQLEELRQKALARARAMREAWLVQAQAQANNTNNTNNTTANITVNGATNPQAVAREVQRVIINSNKNAWKWSY